VSEEADESSAKQASFVANQLQEGIYDMFGRISIDARPISGLLLLFYIHASVFSPERRKPFAAKPAVLLQFGAPDVDFRPAHPSP
jgi:hypothetical protein